MKSPGVALYFHLGLLAMIIPSSTELTMISNSREYCHFTCKTALMVVLFHSCPTIQAGGLPLVILRSNDASDSDVAAQAGLVVLFDGGML